MKLLMQGLSLPTRRVCSASPLPAAQLRPTSPPPPPQQPHIFDEPVDTVGQAKVRGMPPPTLVIAPSSATTTICTVNPPAVATCTSALIPAVPSPSVSRTTQWRQRKKASSQSATPSVMVSTGSTTTTCPGRKEYCCRICSKPMSSPDHSQYRGQRYCPSLYPDISKDVWLTQRRAEAQAKSKSGRTNRPQDPQ